MKEKNYTKVKQIIENYKKNLAKMMRTGQVNEVISLLNDSGLTNAKDRSMMDIAKKSLSATSLEELEIQRVNFIFSLLNRREREIILHEFLLVRPSLWWVDIYSRSTFYRNRRRAINKFLDYFEGNEKSRKILL